MSKRVPSSARPSIHPGVLHEKLEGETVILNAESGYYFGLDPVATKAWEALVDGKSIEQACQLLIAEYDVNEQRVRSDLEELVAELRDHGLLQLVAASKAGSDPDKAD